MTNTGDGFIDELISHVEYVYDSDIPDILKAVTKLCIAETVKELDKRCLVMDAKRHDFVHAVCQDLLNQCGENK